MVDVKRKIGFLKIIRKREKTYIISHITTTFPDRPIRPQRHIMSHDVNPIN